MEKYFEALSSTGAIKIPTQFLEKFGWKEGVQLYQFTRVGEIYITDRTPESVEQNLNDSVLDSSNMLHISKELIDEAGIGFDESLVVYVFYDHILGLAKDFRECVFCGKTSELAPYMDKHICYNCTLQISAIEDEMYK